MLLIYFCSKDFATTHFKPYPGLAKATNLQHQYQPNHDVFFTWHLVLSEKIELTLETGSACKYCIGAVRVLSQRVIQQDEF